MAAPAFKAVTGGAVALSGATVKSVLSVICASNKALTLVQASVSFDGTTASNTPVLVELCQSTQATAGTSSSVTPARIRGPAASVTSSAAKNYTVEPTVLTVVEEWLVPPTSGVIQQLPLGREYEALGVASGIQALVLRLTAPQAVNARASLEWEE